MSSANYFIMNDPKTKYAQPPYGNKTQAKPGETQEMYPLPDHGEESYKGTGRLQGLSAIITGGDSGIGRAVAIAYAREGCDIAFTYLSEQEREDAEATEKLVKEAGRKVISFQMDQSDSQSCDEVVARTLAEFGRLDILINNAAFQDTYNSIIEITDEELDRFFKVNIESFYFFCRAALKKITPGGSIINTSSIQAFKPSKMLSPYSSTKAAIANFTVSLAKEAIEYGVRVNAVAPGPVWTPLIPSTMPPEKVKDFGRETLFERAAQPAELAPVYVFLASDDASYISGEVYGVTGGMKQL